MAMSESNKKVLAGYVQEMQALELLVSEQVQAKKFGNLDITINLVNMYANMIQAMTQVVVATK